MPKKVGEMRKNSETHLGELYKVVVGFNKSRRGINELFTNFQTPP
jgi:hypothetical protein